MIEIISEFKNIEKYKSILPIPALTEYLSYHSDNYGWFISDKFILPFYLTKKFIFIRIFFTTQALPLADVFFEDEKKFLNDIIILSKKNKIDIIELPASNAIFNAYPDKALFTEFGTYIVNLTLPEDELFKNLHSKHRNVIRKAEKDGVLIKFDENMLDECYTLIQNTYKRQGKDFISINKFKDLKKHLGENARFYFAEKEGVIQGCALLLWNTNHSSYYLYGGSIESPYGGSLNLLHWRAMLDMKALGVKCYDFMGARINPDPGSKLEGIQRFKERFGGVLKTGFIWKYPVNKLKYFLFNILTRFYYFSKFQKYHGDIIIQENKKNKKYDR